MQARLKHYIEPRLKKKSSYNEAMGLVMLVPFDKVSFVWVRQHYAIRATHPTVKQHYSRTMLNRTTKSALWLGVIGMTLTGCASVPQDVAKHPQPVIMKPAEPAPAVTPPQRPTRPKSKPAKIPPLSGQALIEQLLPRNVLDRAGWAKDFQAAFRALNIKPNPKNSCAALAITEQESSFNAKPVVAGLPRIVRKEIGQRAEAYHIPEWTLDLTLSMQSPDGRTYAQRIDALRTENDLNGLYADLISTVPLGRQLLEGFNPVKTGGPMQVSLKFAEAHVKDTPYPYEQKGSLRDELFTRRGGLYFGVAYLLDYPVSYERMLYRFADFNAGRYASRNAAFQKAVSQLTGTAMDFDGDLLRYSGGSVSDQPSQTLQAVLTLAPGLKLSQDEIENDLRREKAADFERTQLFIRTFALAKEQDGHPLPPVALPEIRLNSPKITHGLTTARFAQRVEQRYKQCLVRYERLE